MTSRVPGSWSEFYERLAVQFGGGPPAEATAREWVREVLESRYGVQDPTGLPRQRRALAFQRLCGTLLALEDGGDYVFVLGVRRDVAAVFARYFDGLVLEGPPWALDPSEHGQRPTYEDWHVSSDFFEEVGMDQQEPSPALSRPENAGGHAGPPRTSKRGLGAPVRSERG